MHKQNDKTSNILVNQEKLASNIKRLLVLSKGWLHPSLQVRRKFRDMLISFSNDEQNRNYEFIFTSYFKDLIRMVEDDISDDRQFDGIILLMHEKKLPNRYASEFLTSIRRYLSQGGGLMAVHGAMASFKTTPEYSQILGSRFKGHDSPGPIEIHEVNSPVSFILKEELYLHDYDQSIDTLWYGIYNGEKVPVAWAREENSGRIFCFSLGHYASTFENWRVQSIFRDALAWITRRESEL
ncbi:MAG: ThuA domain-containing protein [Clostridiales bacterium]|nr:ThuA domain-containing protein [Clostridiales bacterium]